MKGFIVFLFAYGYSLAFLPIPFVQPHCSTMDYEDCVSYCHCSWELFEDMCVNSDDREKPYFTHVDCLRGDIILEILLLDVSVCLFTCLISFCFCYSLVLLGFRFFRNYRKRRRERKRMIQMDEFGYNHVPPVKDEFNIL